MPDVERKSITLVLCGVRSGKSRFALERAKNFARVSFVATAQPSDSEMAEKIKRHQAERPAGWRTIEEPVEVAKAVEAAGAQSDLIIIDCLTIFAANLLEAASASEPENDPANHVVQLLAALHNTPASIVLVSNEVGSGVVPPYPAGRQFRDLLGEINQKIAATADNVVLMVAGLPLVLKGAIGAHI